MTLPLLLGESPAREDPGVDAPLSGAPARTLCRLAGIRPEGDPYAALREHFDTANVIPCRAEATPWPGALARDCWQQYLIEHPGLRTVVCLGRRAAAAVGIPNTPWFAWTWEPNLAGLAIAAIPHPSGLNRLYNDAGIRESAGRTLREAMARS